ncbi:patatin family phospholipase (macronuclear) [Tetrahymena thermophila SB210]|uniref:Patatin family phospholipase n=1 Tax=Tetrahymena thermophila (strain SB210) TaxID=312017 RepID=Q237S6_TETTS|nr:patatin family phospholipase [Tetrahymena thermophila SB210]EAR92665.1 patatin family phospholipase [Tetrahymena thermophila SB210]|eukprot:XP_001012910.1 patatin family phospholipase [Tetrahymena thermophila SB210]
MDTQNSNTDSTTTIPVVNINENNFKYEEIPSLDHPEPLKVKVNQKKEILLSGGAGAISFQAGYMHGLSEIIPLEVLKEYRVGGVSAGACVAGFFVFSLYSKHDMKYWFEKCIRKLLNVVSNSTFGFWQTTSLLSELAASSYRIALECGVPLDEAFHCYISLRSGFIGYKKHLVDKFINEQQFAEAITCSCTIPFVTSFSFSNEYQGKKAIDGGVTMGIPFRNKDSECIFLNVLPKPFRSYPIVRDFPNHLTTIDIAEDYNLVFPTDYWLWDEQNADKQFVQGYLAAKHQQDKLLKAFNLESKLQPAQ